jgi:hypothetical protein
VITIVIVQGPYREMQDVLGEARRQEDAIARFGRWRSSLRARVLLLFAVIGVAIAPLGYVMVQEWQFEHNDGIALVHISAALGCMLPFLALMAAGAASSRWVVRRRTAAQIERIAAEHEITPNELTEIARLSDGLF